MIIIYPCGVLSSWNHSLHHCFWEGVTCRRKHKRVVMLYLYARGLAGTISPFIGNLNFLRTVVLANNSLHGQIPHEIGRLFRLRSLYIYINNSITGELPNNISGCINLRKDFCISQQFTRTSNRDLWVYSNYFSDSRPYIIGDHTWLEIK